MKRKGVMDSESGQLRVRRCDRSMNRQSKDRGAEMRLMERNRKLIKVRRTERSLYLYTCKF